MKKIFLFLTLGVLTSSVLVSCSKDDEQDPIIGTWYLYSKDNIEVSDCLKKNEITFFEDNTFSNVYYGEYDGECFKGKENVGGERWKDEWKAEWEKEGEKKYKVITETDSLKEEVVFKMNNNKELSIILEGSKVIWKKK